MLELPAYLKSLRRSFQLGRLVAIMACRKTARRVGGTKKRAQRATSNVFAMFDQDQIQEFKEAFNMIDQNRDGFIDHDDLKDMLASLGKVRKFKSALCTSP